jgi:large subunit ribosomal protein L29
MRPSEIREMSPQEREQKLEDLIEEYRGLRFGHVMQQVSNPLELRAMRRDIARLRTIIAEEQAGVSPDRSREPAGEAVESGTEESATDAVEGEKE